MSRKTEWYQMSLEKTFNILKSSEKGLTSDEASKRLKKYGYNEITFKKISPILRFLKQFNNPLIYVLIVAAIVTALLGELIDVGVILGVVIANATIGFIQEGKAESSIEALEKMMVHECQVLRDGEKVTIPSRLLVPGDVVLLESGTKIPADLRIFQSKNLHADEASLTGESMPVRKNYKSIPIDDLSPGDQKSIAFNGTFITQGSGVGVVVATGEKTDMGKIATIMMETKQIMTPLMKKMERFTEILVISILFIALLNFLLSFYFGYGIIYSFMASASLAVAVIPEGLPAVLTIALAFGVKKMANKNVLIRKLPSVEALGHATVICSDKTGTLTKNQMTVLRVYCGNKTYHVSGKGYAPQGDFLLNEKMINASDHGELIKTLQAGLMCNNASLVKNDNYNVIGDPTEGALIVSAFKANVKEKFGRLDEIPFQSQNQFMATLHRGNGKNMIYVKGSPEKILKMCKKQLVNGEKKLLEYDKISTIADSLAKDALRVLGFAYKSVPSSQTKIHKEDMHKLIFLGLQGMMDPPREEVMGAIQKSGDAGIRTVMITGDHALTARAISEYLGIGVGEKSLITGKELSKMSIEEIYQIVDKISVYARVAPEHKYTITTQLQKKGEIVAVTGDGVNDAPALKAADIGIAMGITGTDVSKEASDMVLADDNFASIVNAIEEGRYIFENIRKVILYSLAANGGQGLIILSSVLLIPIIPLFFVTLPLEPVQILWINLFDSLFLALPLIKEPKEKGLLKYPPRDPKEQIVNSLFLRKVGIVSFAMAFGALSIFLIFGMPALNPLNELLINQAQTAAFTTVILVHIFYLITARSLYDSAFSFSPVSNKWLIVGIISILISLLMIIYFPPLEIIFRTTAIPFEWWPLIILFALPGFILIEMEKWIFKLRKTKKKD
ncbi:cation-translocating P-type ATPase [Methanobacterium alcaliphilum]|uniref:cation-translocating P-type ATPase n=1 Tax=Methanobacterium alcaliphilum TaxID=392018 RepID=UPI00200B80B8|nr:HAD-IC family P-type ATPase [Methanobacterium alcaliphilum]MCK9151056.1 HAD-IC family P-type ATPase [Methanobacterium alcaliphilum]